MEFVHRVWSSSLDGRILTTTLWVGLLSAAVVLWWLWPSKKESTESPVDIRARRQEFLQLLENQQNQDLLLQEETTSEVHQKRSSLTPAKQSMVQVTASKKKYSSNVERRRPVESVSRATPRESTAPPPMHSQVDQHPGLEAYWYWCDVQNSLYRIYTLGRSDGNDDDEVPPYHPSSRRGQVPIELRVTNQLPYAVQVYWVTYKGQHEPKGRIAVGHTWTQSTWIDHPWVFKKADDDDDATILLHYIPYRVIPTTAEEPTTHPDDPTVGMHRFTLQRPPPTSPYLCSVDDPILPFPAQSALTDVPEAVAWTLQYCRRLDYCDFGPVLELLQQIVDEPYVVTHRQWRLAGDFGRTFWETPVRGLLLAIGFVEHYGYAELGTQEPLAAARVGDIQWLSWEIQKHQPKESLPSNVDQPQGADGYGAAGYGRAGAMN